MIVLPPFQKSVVIGVLLSDGHLASTKPHENPRLEFKQSLQSSAYVLFVFSFLSSYCNVYLYLVALAHFIMGDGVAKQHGLILCTDSYNIVDIVRLINVLIIRYNLDCTIRSHTSNQSRIYIRERSMPILRELVKNHMVKSMLYKVGL